MVSEVFCIYALFTFTEFFFSSLVFPYFSAFFKAGLSLCFPHFLLFTQFFRFPDIFCEFRILLRFLIFSSNLSFPAFLLPFSKFRKFSAVFNFFRFSAIVRLVSHFVLWEWTIHKKFYWMIFLQNGMYFCDFVAIFCLVFNDMITEFRCYFCIGFFWCDV